MRNLITTVIQFAGLLGLFVAGWMYLPVSVAAVVTVSGVAFLAGFLMVEE